MEVKIWNDFLTNTYKVFVIERNRTTNAHYKYTDNGIEMIEHKSGEIMPPFIEIPEDMFNNLVKSFMIYGSEKGIETENENLTKGKLIVTEKHLEHSNKNLDKLIDFVIKTKK